MATEDKSLHLATPLVSENVENIYYAFQRIL